MRAVLTLRAQSAAGERIPHVAVQAVALRLVVHHAALRVGPAPSRARVHALCADARQVRGTVGAEQALGPAVGRRTQEIGQTRARG